MNNLITIPLAVLYSLNFAFQVETTSLKEDTSTINVEATTTESAEDYAAILIHNADVGIFPGSTSGKTFVPKSKLNELVINDFIVTGIKAAEDGTQILLHATMGRIELKANNSNSSFGNRIEQSSDMIIEFGEIFELTYSATLNKWVITNDNF